MIGLEPIFIPPGYVNHYTTLPMSFHLVSCLSRCQNPNWFVAGEGLEPPASRLWAWRAAAALPRNVIGCERVGFEPTTSGLWDQRATRLLHPAMFGYDGRPRTSIPYWATFMKNTFLFLHLKLSRGASIPLPCHTIVYLSVPDRQVCYLFMTRVQY